MDRLTKGEIEEMCEAAIGLDSNRAQENRRWTRLKAEALRDLALQSLSQEAVRDEALENVLGIAGMLEFQAKLVLSNGESDIKLDAAIIVPKIVESLRALKREPNAAGA